MALSSKLSVSLHLVAGLNNATSLGSTFCLSPPGLSCLNAEIRACTAGQGLVLRFSAHNQAQRVSSPSRRLAPQDKAWVLVLLAPQSSALLEKSWGRTTGQGLGVRFDSLHWLSMSSRRVASSHLRTRLWSTLYFSHPSSALFLAKPRASIARQRLGLRFASLHQAQCVSSLSHRIASRNKAWFHALPFSTLLSVPPLRVAGSHRATRLGSMLCLSPPGSACVLAESWAQTAGQCLGPRFASHIQA